MGQPDLCKHGQQLRWHYAECDEHFKEREKPKAKQKGVDHSPRQANQILY
jgi:hypothetical protein